MSKPDTWMPIYIGDYMADTMHLTTEQHGTYLLLLLTAWNRGGTLPNDEVQLATICRADKKTWARVRGAVMPFFKIEDGKLVQGRLIAEYEKAVAFNGKQKANGMLGGRPKKTQTGTQKKPMGFDRDNPEHNPNESPSPSPVNLTLNPPSSVDQPSSEGGTEGNATRVGALCKQLRSMGIDAAPHLKAWADILPAYSDAEIIAVAEIAREKKPGERIHLNYLVPMLRDRAQPKAGGGGQKFDPVAHVNRNRKGNGNASDDGNVIDGHAQRVA